MEQICPRCKTTSYQNPNMKLLVNVCGHKLCDSCVDAVFTRPSAACPECGLALRRNLFRLQQFEDSYVEKEVDIRKKVLKDYNKVEEDFTTLADYNDYLEEIETIVFNLANGIDVEETKRKVEQYKKENQSVIVKNRARQLRQEQFIKNSLEVAKAEQEQRNKMAAEKEKEAAKMKKKQKESLLNELMSSDKPPEEVVADFKASLEAEEQEQNKPVESTSLFSRPEFQQQLGEVALDALPIEQGVAYSYEPLVMDIEGPEVPDPEQLKTSGHIKNIRPLEPHNVGGGFLPVYACQRALQEAFSCLNWNLEHR